eukprot:Gb_05041 [translate_table: standard]
MAEEINTSTHQLAEFDAVDDLSIQKPNEAIPVIDLSPFFLQDEYSNPSVIRSRQSVIEQVGRACEEWGFFQAINHGVPVELIQQALASSNSFFDLPVEEKMKVRPDAGRTMPIPTGYRQSLPGTRDLYEYFITVARKSESPTDSNRGNSQYNVFPKNLPQFRSVIEKLLICLVTAADGESGFPKSWGTNKHEIGGWEHKDGNCITLVGQDDCGGYQVLNGQKWVDVAPIKGALVVNIGDILQCVEPLPNFTAGINSPAAYRPFLYKDYLLKRVLNHPLTMMTELESQFMPFDVWRGLEKKEVKTNNYLR